MSNILAPYCGGQLGLPVNDSAGASAGNKNQHIWVLDRRVEVLTDGSIAHWGDGLPFNADGRLLISVGAVVDYDQGIPFTASGHVAVGPGPIQEWDQGLPLNAAGQIVTTTEVNDVWPPPPLRPPPGELGPVVSFPVPLLDLTDGDIGQIDLQQYSEPDADTWTVANTPSWVSVTTDGLLTYNPVALVGNGSFITYATIPAGTTSTRAYWIVTGIQPVIDVAVPAFSVDEPNGGLISVTASHSTGASLHYFWEVFDGAWRAAETALSNATGGDTRTLDIIDTDYDLDGGFTQIRCRVRAYGSGEGSYQVYSTNTFAVVEVFAPPVLSIPSPLLNIIDGDSGNVDLEQYNSGDSGTWTTDGGEPAWVTVSGTGSLSFAPFGDKGSFSFAVTCTNGGGADSAPVQIDVAGVNPDIDIEVPSFSVTEPIGGTIPVTASHPTSASLHYLWEVSDGTYQDAETALSNATGGTTRILTVGTTSYDIDGAFTSVRCRVRAYGSADAENQVYSTNSFTVEEGVSLEVEYLHYFETDEDVFTHTRNSEATVYDHEGIIRTVPDKVPAMVGARFYDSRCPLDFNGWTVNNETNGGTCTFNPDGSLTLFSPATGRAAVRYDIDTFSGPALCRVSLKVQRTEGIEIPYLVAVQAYDGAAVSDVQKVRLQSNNNEQYLSGTFSVTTASLGDRIRLIVGSGAHGSSATQVSFNLWEPVVEVVTDASVAPMSAQPSTPVFLDTTNGNTLTYLDADTDSVTEAPGTALTTMKGLQVEEERTNALLHSDNFDDGAWDLRTLVTTAYHPTIKAPDGSPAYQVTDQGGGHFGSSGRIVAGDHLSIYARTVSGTGLVSLFWHNSENTLQTLTEEWQRFDLPQAPNASYNGDFYVADFRHGTTTATDILVWGPQCEQGDYPTSYIPTAAATTRARTDVYATMTDMGMDDQANDLCGQHVLRLRQSLDDTDSDGLFGGVYADSASRIIFQALTTRFIRAELAGTGQVDSATLPAMSPGAKIDIRWRKSSTDGLALWVDRVKTENVSFTGDFATALSTLGIGIEAVGLINTAFESSMIRLLNEAKDDATIEGWPSVIDQYLHRFEADTSAFAFTRASDATVEDHEGIVREIPDNVPAMVGARVVRNLMDGISWTDGGAATLVDYGGDHYTISGMAAIADFARLQVLTLGDLEGRVFHYVISLRADGDDVGKQTRLELKRVIGGASGATKTLTPTLTADWVTYVLTFTGLLDNENLQCKVTGNTGYAAEVHFRYTMLEEVTFQSNQNPGSWVESGGSFDDTNGNTVDGSGVVTEAPGTPLTTMKGLLLEEERTNYAPGSSSDAGWSVGAEQTITNDVDTLLGQPVFEAEAAGILVASAYLATGVGSVTSGDSVFMTLWIKGVTGSARALFRLNGSGVWATIGDMSLDGPGTIIESMSGVLVENLSNSEWTKVSVRYVSANTADHTMYLFPCTFDAVAGIKTHVSMIQLEHGTFPTSHIPTSGAAYTRVNATAVAQMQRVLPNNFCFQVVIELICDWNEMPDNSYLFEYRGDADNRIYMYKSSTAGRAFLTKRYGGTNASAQINGLETLVKGDTIDIKARISSIHAAGIKLWANALTPGTNTNQTALSVAPVTMSLTANNTGGSNSYAIVKAVRVVDDALSDADIEAWDWQNDPEVPNYSE